MAGETIDVPPFPRLTWDEFFWVGEVRLPSWAGFQARRGAYAARSDAAPSDGTARLSVSSLDEARTPPTPEQAAALQHLLDYEAAVFAAASAALVEYGAEHIDDFESDEPPPEVNGVDDLRGLVGLYGVHVLTPSKDGVAYVGLEFGCTWDEEHGAGVMLHRDRVVDVGGADSSFLGWIAERDAAG